MSEEKIWTPDILGKEYEMTTVRQPDDYVGPVVCTVVRFRSSLNCKRGILYIHGFNDYFFQTPMGRISPVRDKAYSIIFAWLTRLPAMK